MPQNPSAIVAGRITETETRVSALDSELSAIELQLNALAEAAEIDTEALNRLQGRKQAVLAELDLLTRRIAFLKGAFEKAENEEAASRIAEIEAETKALAKQGVELTGRFAEGMGIFLALVEEAQALVRSRSMLAQEAEYRRVKYELPWPDMTQLPVPKIDDLRPLVLALESLLHVNVPSTEWSREAEKIKREREKERAKNAPKSAGITVIDNSPSREELLRKAYAERANAHDSEVLNAMKPNIMQALLSDTKH